PGRRKGHTTCRSFLKMKRPRDQRTFLGNGPWASWYGQLASVRNVLLLLIFLAVVCRRLGLAVNPAVRQIRDLGDGEQFIATKARGRFPFVAILVAPGQTDVVPGAVVTLVGPDRGLD